MSEVRGLFRRFQRDYRPLSAELRRRHLLPALRRIAAFESATFGQTDDALVKEIVSEVELRPPRLLGAEVASSRQGEGDRRPGSDSAVTVQTNRHYVAIQIDGDESLLEFWPDKASGLEPIDEFDSDPWGKDRVPAPYTEAAAVLRHKMRQTQNLWQLAFRTHHDEVRALYTFVDLTNSEEMLVASGDLDVRAEVDANRGRVEPIVEAIAEQCRAFVAETLPRGLRKAIAERRERLRTQASVRESLAWSDGWIPEPPRLEAASRVEQEVSNTATSLRLPDEARFDPSSFDDIQRILRRWADQVERTPKAFRDMSEDHLSDLLAALLSSHAPGTGREVYSRSGKTDIFIRADVLRSGAGPAKVFILEAKWWDGAAKALAALNQLLGYLEAKDTSAILLFYVDKHDPTAVRDRCLSVLARRPGCVKQEEGPVDGWPILGFSIEGLAVSIAVCFVDLAVCELN